MNSLLPGSINNRSDNRSVLHRPRPGISQNISLSMSLFKVLNWQVIRDQGDDSHKETIRDRLRSPLGAGNLKIFPRGNP